MSDYTELTDIELVQKSHDRDTHALEVLMERYKPIVYQKTQGYFLADAGHDDIVQEGMIGLYLAIMSFDAEKSDSFHAYAAICITRQLITAIRKSQSKKHTLLNTSLSMDCEDVEPGDTQSIDPMAYVLGRETLDVILDSISGDLSKLEADALKLRLSGRSLDEIAQMLGKSRKSVDNALQRMKKKIGKRVE